MSNPWFKFHPRDWRGDQALRAVSIAARGLWIECLCIMHEAKPYGHLVLNGDPVGDDTLARMTGISVQQVSDCMSELKQAGVLSITREGVVFSRRMTKDHARARKGRLSAKKRWSQVSDGVEQSDAPNGSPNGTPITQKPDSRTKEDANASLSETSSDPPKKSRSRNSYPEAFEKLWRDYPTDPLMSKKAAYQAWQRMDEEARGLAMQSIPSFRAYCRQNTDYRPVHLVRYLQQERFVGFVGLAKKKEGQVFVPKDTPAFAAWQNIRPTPKARSESGEEGWWFPAEWPSEVRAGNA